ncbi:MAG TPA: hypothetical protein VFQ26_09030 [Nitrospiraceae bacterium]|nr:hypothetical protein [Nitrospiraceae bacterium]
MSDYDPSPGGDPGPYESGPEIDLGVAADDGQTTDQPAYEEPKNYLEVDEVADRYVRVKADGEELEVPLREALQGYSRQADYTRKTQELAQQRQQAEYALAVQRALQARPEETLRILAKEYGLHYEPTQSPPAVQGSWEQPSPYDDGEDSYADPLERRLNEQQRMLDSLMQREQQQQADQVLRAAVGGLQQKYQLNDADVREVVGTALQARMGPESFEMIYKNIAYDREQNARAQAMATRQAQEAQREAAKQRGQQLVGSGPSANSAGGLLPGASDGHMSVSEAYELALKEHGVG